MSLRFLVSESGPTCVCTAIDATSAILACGVTYAESRIQPSYPLMTWVTDSGSVVVPEDRPTPVPNGNYDDSTSYYTVYSNGASSYNCTLTYSAPDSAPISYLDLNPPTFTATCTVTSKNPFRY